MKGFRYILFILALLASVSMRGQYNPTNPAEPGTYYTLTLQATPSNGGSFNLNATTSYTEGTSVSIRAYTNTNFTFECWELDGEVYSTSSTIKYIMPAKNVKLIARYKYTPSSPSEPSEPNIPVYSNLYLEASPLAGGSFNINSGNRYEVGTKVNVRTYTNSNYVFKNWTEDGVVISTSASFSYEMKAGNPKLTANFEYNPSNPSEPQEPVVSHKLYLKSNPSGGGYFNTESGNSYAEGSSVYLRAYSNQWYTFQNWTDENGEVVSTQQSFYYTMPKSDKTLTANFSYYYNPGSPSEPSEPADNGVNIYGMTENGIRSQQLAYPIYLENPIEVKEMKIDMQFPEGFVVNSNDVRIAGRAMGHDAEVTSLENNTYRIYIKGDDAFSGKNGKLFEILVTIPENAETAHSYPVVLTHGVIHGTDGSQTPVTSVRSGYIYVGKVSEDGLYARFGFEKLLNRVQFNNMSSDKAVRYEWDFGDGSTSTEQNPTHVYAEPGFYDVIMTAYGKSGEDVAQMTVLINDSQYWTIGGTLVLTSQKGSVRYFDSIESLLSFVDKATVTENIIIGVQAGESFELANSGETLALLACLETKLRSNNFSLTVKTIGDGCEPTFAYGNSSDEITDAVLSQWNSLGLITSCVGVKMMLCGVDYNPAAINAIEDQVVCSGDDTQEMDFTAISMALSFSWQLTTTPNDEYVGGYKSAGEGNIPVMTIDNIDNSNFAFVYHVTGKKGDAVFCEFDKTITVKSGSSSITLKEWVILCQLQQELVAQGWKTPWNLSGGREGDTSFKGVTIDRSHIVGIDLSHQSLTGTIPACVFTFPKLATLSFAHNELSGNIDKMFADMASMIVVNPSFKSSLKILDLSHNNFTGDIGLITNASSALEQLETLDVSHNGLTNVSKALPLSIKSLNISCQASDKVLYIDFANTDVKTTVEELPSLFRYSHKEQTWLETSKIRISDYCPAENTSGEKWEFTIEATDESIVMSSPSGKNTFRGNSGDKLYVSYPSAKEEVKNSYCYTTYSFEQGDVNFSGKSDITDLQATVLYMFGEYQTKPFNFTAANLFNDGTINVQDIICMVNLLLDKTASPAAKAAHSREYDNKQYDVELFVDDNKVYMKSASPVAAIHMVSDGDIEWTLDQYGLTQTTGNNGVVAYSLKGITLPEELIMIGKLRGTGTLYDVSATDALAQPLSVRLNNGAPTGIDNIVNKTNSGCLFSVSGVGVSHQFKGLCIEKRNNRYVKTIKQ